MRHKMDYSHEWKQHERRIKKEWIAESTAIIMCYAASVGFAFVMYFYC